MEKLLSVDEVAAYLDLPVQTIYTWRYRGLGPQGFKVGRHLRYRSADVERWLESRADVPKPAA